MSEVLNMPRSCADPTTVLRQPYSRVLTPDEESGTYTARIQEFPGCVAQGDSPAEAYEKLEQAARSWIVAAQDLGQEIPRPRTDEAFSGRILLRLPKSLHRKAAAMAEQDGTSLNQFIVTAVAECVGASKAATKLQGEIEQRIATSVTSYKLVFTALDLFATKETAGTPPTVHEPRRISSEVH